jgi:hypothetical protein
MIVGLNVRKWAKAAVPATSVSHDGAAPNIRCPHLAEPRAHTPAIG